MVFNGTFNNLLVIPWRSVLLVEETSVHEKTAALPHVTETLYHIMLYTSFERDSNYAITTTTTTPYLSSLIVPCDV